MRKCSESEIETVELQALGFSSDHPSIDCESWPDPLHSAGSSASIARRSADSYAG